MPNSLNVFLIDPDERQLSVLHNSLAQDYNVQSFQSIETAVDKAKELKPEMIISELEFEQADAIEYIMELRSFSDAHTYKPLIAIYTAVADNYAQVAVYNAGADAYWLKHQTANVIKKKLLGLKRRLYWINRNEIIKLGNIEIDRERHLVLSKGEEYTLPKKEFELLELLARNPDRIISREELKESLWGPSNEQVKLRTIDVHVRKLRSKLGDQIISTVVGEGYKIQNV